MIMKLNILGCGWEGAKLNQINNNKYLRITDKPDGHECCTEKAEVCVCVCLCVCV